MLSIIYAGVATPISHYNDLCSMGLMAYTMKVGMNAFNTIWGNSARGCDALSTLEPVVHSWDDIAVAFIRSAQQGQAMSVCPIGMAFTLIIRFVLRR